MLPGFTRDQRRYFQFELIDDRLANSGEQLRPRSLLVTAWNFVDDHQPRAILGVGRNGGTDLRRQLRARLGNRCLQVLRMIISATDNKDILAATTDKQLALLQKAKVAGAQIWNLGPLGRACLEQRGPTPRFGSSSPPRRWGPPPRFRRRDLPARARRCPGRQWLLPGHQGFPQPTRGRPCHRPARPGFPPEAAARKPRTTGPCVRSDPVTIRVASAKP